MFFEKYHQTKHALHPAIRSNISSERIFASCVCYSDRASWWMPALIKGRNQRLTSWRLMIEKRWGGGEGSICQLSPEVVVVAAPVVEAVLVVVVVVAVVVAAVV